MNLPGPAAAAEATKIAQLQGGGNVSTIPLFIRADFASATQAVLSAIMALAALRGRRRLMVIGLHERLSGHPSRVRVLDRILTRLRERSNVWWARKDQLARYALDHPDAMTSVDRAPMPVSGLPGRSGRPSNTR